MPEAFAVAGYPSPGESCSSGSSSPAWPEATRQGSSPSLTPSLYIDDLGHDLVKLCLAGLPQPSKIDHSTRQPPRRRRMHKTQTSSNKSRKLTDSTAPESTVPNCSFTFTNLDAANRWSQLSSLCRFPVNNEGHGKCRARACYPKQSVNAKYTIPDMPPVVIAPPCKDMLRKRYVFAPFNFLGLPSELRDLIYQDVLTSDIKHPRMHLSLEKTTGAARTSRIPFSAFALLSTSRQLRMEALPVFYKLQHFYIHAVPSLPTLINRLSPAAVHNIEFLDIHFWGMRRRHQLFYQISHVCGLKRLHELRLHFDFFTLKQISEHIGGTDSKSPFCQHHQFIDDAARKNYETLFKPSVRRDRVSMQIIFKDRVPPKGPAARSSGQDWPESECVCCAVINGMKVVQGKVKLRDANEESSRLSRSSVIPTCQYVERRSEEVA